MPRCQQPLFFLVTAKLSGPDSAWRTKAASGKFHCPLCLLRLVWLAANEHINASSLPFPKIQNKTLIRRRSINEIHFKRKHRNVIKGTKEKHNIDYFIKYVLSKISTWTLLDWPHGLCLGTHLLSMRLWVTLLTSLHATSDSCLILYWGDHQNLYWPIPDEYVCQTFQNYLCSGV